MGQALYRKYRSKSLADIVGQEHITKTLEQAIKTNRVSHAYLFTGPRGVGKTSIARILAHDINGLEYSDDQMHVDIIEIDAASNRRIDEIRDLREKVYIAPTQAKYKVYIIDEVHMLTKEAFNALLKTLEEPPQHVVFILATTDAHKLPETIISRTQRFQFKPIEVSKAVDHLKDIASKESIVVDEAALQLIAEHGQGSFRDSIGLLDQAANFAQPITSETINSLLGTPPSELIDKALVSVANGDTKLLVSQLNYLFEQGYPAQIIASRIAAQLREQLIEGKPILDTNKLLDLLEQLLDVPSSSSPENLLEICLLRAMPASKQPVTVAATVYTTIQTKETAIPLPKETASKPAATVTADEKPKTMPEKAKKTDKTGTNEETPIVKLDKVAVTHSTEILDEKLWPEILNVLKSKYNTLYGIVRMARLETSTPGTIQLQFAFPFHQKRINDSRNRQAILSAVEQVTAKSFTLECIVDPALLAKPKASTPEPDLSAISDIFGGGEVVDE